MRQCVLTVAVSNLDWLTTYKAAMVHNFSAICLFACLYVCLSDDNFESLDVGSSFLHIRYISREYGSHSYMKVIGSKSKSQEQKGRKSLFVPCKILISNNFSSVQHRAMKFACSMGYSAWQIEWCDHYLCHVTRSDHAWLSAPCCGWSALD